MNLEFDIKRSIILAEYIKCWGVPDTRKVCDSMPIELYIFPGEDMDQVTRVVTIGLSSCKFSNDKACNNELLMVFDSLFWLFITYPKSEKTPTYIE